MDARVKPAHDAFDDLIRGDASCPNESTRRMGPGLSLSSGRRSRTRWPGRLLYAYRPWQCLYFLPEPHGQSSLRPILPQLEGVFGSRLCAVAIGAGGTEPVDD